MPGVEVAEVEEVVAVAGEEDKCAKTVDVICVAAEERASRRRGQGLRALDAQERHDSLRTA